jgi:hypothetical protein
MKIKRNKKGQVKIPNEFKRITLKELLPGDILLFYYGNKLTEWHGKWRKKKYGRSTKPPFHAAIVYDWEDASYYDPDNNKIYRMDVFILDPEISTTLSFLQEYLQKKKIRIDVVRFRASDYEREKIKDTIKNVASKEGFYDWRGYFSFISQMPFLKWAGFIKPSKKDFYCSDASAFCVHKATDIQVSPRNHNITAPVDLQLYALKHHKLYTLKQTGEFL